MTLPGKSNAALVEEIQNEEDPKVVQDYKKIGDKCEAVLDKISKRKKNSNKDTKKSKK